MTRNAWLLICLLAKRLMSYSHALIFPFYYFRTFWLMAAALDEIRKTEHTIHATIDGVFPIKVQTKEKLIEL